MRTRLSEQGETISSASMLAGYSRALRASIAADTGFPFPLDLPIVEGDDVEFGSRNSTQLRRGAFVCFLPNSRCRVRLHRDPGSRALMEMYTWRFSRIPSGPGDDRKEIHLGDAVGVTVQRGSEKVYRTGDVVGFSWVHDEKGVPCQRAYVLEHAAATAPPGRPTNAESRLLGAREGGRERKRVWEPHEADIRRVYRGGVEVARVPWVSEESRVPHPEERALAQTEVAMSRISSNDTPPVANPVDIQAFVFREGDEVSYDGRGGEVYRGRVLYAIANEAGSREVCLTREGGSVTPRFERLRAAWRGGVLVAARRDVFVPETAVLPEPWDVLRLGDEVEYLAGRGTKRGVVVRLDDTTFDAVGETAPARGIRIGLAARVWRSGVLVAIDRDLVADLS